MHLIFNSFLFEFFLVRMHLFLIFGLWTGLARSSFPDQRVAEILLGKAGIHYSETVGALKSLHAKMNCREFLCSVKDTKKLVTLIKTKSHVSDSIEEAGQALFSLRDDQNIDSKWLVNCLIFSYFFIDRIDLLKVVLDTIPELATQFTPKFDSARSNWDDLRLELSRYTLPQKVSTNIKYVTGENGKVTVHGDDCVGSPFLDFARSCANLIATTKNFLDYTREYVAQDRVIAIFGSLLILRNELISRKNGRRCILLGNLESGVRRTADLVRDTLKSVVESSAVAESEKEECRLLMEEWRSHAALGTQLIGENGLFDELMRKKPERDRTRVASFGKNHLDG